MEVPCVVESETYGLTVAHIVCRPPPTIKVDCDEEADPTWELPRPVDVILGADVVGRILKGPAVGRPGELLRQTTRFGEAYFGVAEIQPPEEPDPSLNRLTAHTTVRDFVNFVMAQTNLR